MLVMLARLGAAHDQLAAEKFLVVQFFDGPFRFLHGLHLNEGKTFRALIVTIAHHFCVLNMSNTVEQFEKIAFGGIEGEIAHVQTWRSNLYRFGFARRPRRLRAVTRDRCCWFP